MSKEEPTPKKILPVYTDWQLKCEDVKQRGTQLLTSEVWSDCSFVVGTEETMCMRAHKLILASASPVFEAMFFGGLAELGGNDPVTVTDIPSDVFKALLLYIYSDRLDKKSFEYMCEMYYAAKKYMLVSLAKKCVTYLKVNLSADNVCQAYELFQLFDEKALVALCFQKMCSLASKVVTGLGFQHAHVNTVLELFSQKTLPIDSEVELFSALETYTLNNQRKGVKRKSDEIVCGQEKRIKTEQISNMENSFQADSRVKKELGVSILERKSDSECKDDELKQGVRKCVEQIRFLTMTAAQFAEGPMGSELLTADEAFSIMLNIIDKDTIVEYPPGLSSSRVRRDRTSVVQTSGTADNGGSGLARYRFSVLNFKSRRRRVDSPKISVRGDYWYISVYPKNREGDSEKMLYMSVNRNGSAARAARGSLRVRSPWREILLEMPFTHHFTQDRAEVKFPPLVWADAIDPSSGYTRGNTLDLELELAVDGPTDIFGTTG